MEKQRERDYAMLVEFQAKTRKEANPSLHPLSRKVNIAYNFPPVPQSPLCHVGQVAIETDEATHGDPQASTPTRMEQPGPNSSVTLEMETISDAVLYESGPSLPVTNEIVED